VQRRIYSDTQTRMPRKLKAYVTSVGFFDLAVAAPSMKAALEAWGAERNLFQGGFARETEEPEIVSATMAKPGVVLRRAVGSKGIFSEHAELPKSLPVEPPRQRPVKARPPKPEKRVAVGKVVSLADERAARQAAAAFEKEQARRAREREKEEARETRERKHREKAIGKAEAALEDARQKHEKAIAAIEAERRELDKRREAQSARWEKEREKLEAALRKLES